MLKNLFFLFFLCSINLVAQVPQKGDVVYHSNFDNEFGRKEWFNPENAKWENNGMHSGMCLSLDGEGMSHSFVDVTAYRGLKLSFKCYIRAQNVIKKNRSSGIKFIFHHKSLIGEFSKYSSVLSGTFDWKEVRFSAAIPNDVSKIELLLGLQGGSGKVWFDSISISVENAPPPSINKQFQSESKVTRNRGFMSPGRHANISDFTVLNTWNVNIIRWQINRAEVSRNMPIKDVLEDYDRWISNELVELDSMIIKCKSTGIKLVIDLHYTPGGRDSTRSLNMLYHKEYMEKFIQTWRLFAKHCRGNSVIYGYDLVNEPVISHFEDLDYDYFNLENLAAEEIRKIDENTPIIFEVDEWDSPVGFVGLVPVKINNCIYEVHMYQPMRFTHQGVIEQGPYDEKKGIVYPGPIGDKNRLKQMLQPVRDFQLKYNVPIYVGEFSAVRWAPGSSIYLDDCINIFEEYGWDWSYHAFREWSGWDVEYENGASKTDVPKKAMHDTDRKEVLLKWFERNVK